MDEYNGFPEFPEDEAEAERKKLPYDTSVVRGTIPVRAEKQCFVGNTMRKEGATFLVPEGTPLCTKGNDPVMVQLDERGKPVVPPVAKATSNPGARGRKPGPGRRKPGPGRRKPGPPGSSDESSE